MGFDTVRPVEHKTYTKNHPSIQAISKTFEEGTFNKPLQPEQRQYLLDDGFQWILVYPEYSPMDISRWSHFLGISGIEIQGIWVFPLGE